jgi:hypothetical protein
MLRSKRFERVGSDLTPYPFLHIFPQDQHERLLIERLEALGVSIERRIELVSFTSRSANLKPERISCRNADRRHRLCPRIDRGPESRFKKRRPRQTVGSGGSMTAMPALSAELWSPEWPESALGRRRWTPPRRSARGRSALAAETAQTAPFLANTKAKKMKRAGEGARLTGLISSTVNLAQKTLHATGLWRDKRLEEYEHSSERAWRSHHRRRAPQDIDRAIGRQRTACRHGARQDPARGGARSVAAAARGRDSARPACGYPRDPPANSSANERARTTAT